MILVTGAGGMLGTHLLDVYAEHEIFATNSGAGGFPSLDVRDRDQVEAVMDQVRPRLVLHMAAMTDVDRCEREVDLAYRSNTIGTLNVALACQARNIELVYVSTC